MSLFFTGLNCVGTKAVHGFMSIYSAAFMPELIYFNNNRLTVTVSG